MTILDSARQFSNLTQDSNGDLYMRSGIEGKRHELWRYANPLLALAGLRERLEAAAADGSVGQPQYKQADNALRQAVHHWEGGRRDSAVHFLDKAVAALGKDGEQAEHPVVGALLARLNDVIGMM